MPRPRGLHILQVDLALLGPVLRRRMLLLAGISPRAQGIQETCVRIGLVIVAVLQVSHVDVCLRGGLVRESHTLLDDSLRFLLSLSDLDTCGAALRRRLVVHWKLLVLVLCHGLRAASFPVIDG